MVNFRLTDLRHKKLSFQILLTLSLLVSALLMTSFHASPALAADRSCEKDKDCNNPNKECKNKKCQDKKDGGGGGGGGGANPQTPAGTEYGNDSGTTANLDPDPARVGNEECAIDGKDGAGTQTELGCVPKDPGGFAVVYYRVGLGLIGGLSVLFIIIGGYLVMTSQGNPERLKNGKTYLFYAMFGLLLAIFGFVFIEVIAVDILHLPGFER